MHNPTPSPSPNPAELLAQLVIKQGVALGGLAPQGRAMALALVWAGLGREPSSEAAINHNLKGQLAAAASFLDTDHVELRRWLVDTGWLRRDDWCRVYQRAAVEALPSEQQYLALALAAPLAKPDAWVAEQRATHAAQRAARRAAWQGS